jgi:hypothetical protein
MARPSRDSSNPGLSRLPWLGLLWACAENPPPPPPTVPVKVTLPERDRLASMETLRFASWLVAQEGDGVVLLLPLQPIRARLCTNIGRFSFGERWDQELLDTPREDPLEEGGWKPMSEETKEDFMRVDPLSEQAPQLEILPPEDQLPFADLPGESLYQRRDFGTHLSFDLWDSDRRQALPLTDEMMGLIIGDWQGLTRKACQGVDINEDAWEEESEQGRQDTLARARRIGLRYLVVDTELFGESGMFHLSNQVEPHLVGRYDFTDGTGVTIFELISNDVTGHSLRSGRAANPSSEQ